MADSNSSERPTEETRLTSTSNLTIQESSLMNTSRNPYYYTGAIDLEETKSFASVNLSQTPSRRSMNMTDHFMMDDDDSCIDYILKEDDNAGASSSLTLPSPTTSAANMTTTPLKKNEQQVQQLALASQPNSADKSMDF